MSVAFRMEKVSKDLGVTFTKSELMSVLGREVWTARVADTMIEVSAHPHALPMYKMGYAVTIWTETTSAGKDGLKGWELTETIRQMLK